VPNGNVLDSAANGTETYKSCFSAAGRLMKNPIANLVSRGSAGRDVAREAGVVGGRAG
jgi:hypothetical protein